MDCIFCKIVAGEVASSIVYQDNEILAFKDLYPKAPQHYLIIPKRHIATLNDFTTEDVELLGKMGLVAQSLAKQLKIDKEGYRVMINCNQNAGQVVYHVHMHLLGGRRLA